ncbi:FAD-binding oxidoreductase [Mangrovicoccus sp. HB161399]|uniref:NAD(P)/FAD-dependent oxidoreductase n=1 Tax=Mangrovicoccus sp. HB161399 TaxID=2720392 RepID=UPI0015549407|nr:FAD-binding oxidoreductase [Mangrovicoccus sp. HB161399]
MAEIAVIGAGMAGIGAALALQARGHEVLVLDRLWPGEGTSHGNAGLIQAEAAEPYAMPRAPAQLFAIATGRTNDVVWHPRSLPGELPVLWSYFRRSAPKRHAAISEVYRQLTGRAVADHAPVIAEAGAEALIRRTGFGEVAETGAALEATAREAERMRDRHGIASRVAGGTELRAEDPAFREGLAGAVIWRDSWSTTDPGALTAAYARLFKARGGRVARVGVTGIVPDRAGWSVATETGLVEAAQVVLAAGPWSAQLLKPLGYRIPMLLKRGYHGHFRMEGELSRPYFLTGHGVVVASMARGLRITTGAELTGQEARRDLRQLVRGEAAARAVLPLGEAVPDSIWHGHRPCLPDMIPLVGPAPRHDGLWFDFGHGHHGLTLGPTTGILLAEMMEGRDDALARALSPRCR